MHDSVLAWVREALTPAHVSGQRVIEVGSYNVNGSVRSIVEALGPASYLGIDIEAGPGVDRVCPLTDARSCLGSFDLVICTEVLEHVVDWKTAILALVDLTRHGGYLLITTRSPGFPYHPYPIDTWRYTVEALRQIGERLGLIIEDIDDDRDPQSPGVFLLARKPLTRMDLLDTVPGVTPMIAP